MRPAVTVVIPTYNRAALLPRALGSVLEQTAADRCEIIVVDDGSTDATAAVLARYGARIRVIRQPNRGLGGARNTGIRAAAGEFIAFLDDDDLWVPDKLAVQLAAFARWPLVGLVGGRVLECAPGQAARHRALPPIPVDGPVDLAPWLMESQFPAAVRGHGARRSAAQERALPRPPAWRRGLSPVGPAGLSRSRGRAVGRRGALRRRVARLALRPGRADAAPGSFGPGTSCGASCAPGPIAAAAGAPGCCVRSPICGMCPTGVAISPRPPGYGLRALLHDPLGRARWEWRRCGMAALRAVLG